MAFGEDAGSWTTTEGAIGWAIRQHRDGVTLRRWSLSRAWPIKFVAGEWDNESDENVIEQVTLTYDFFELVQ